MKLKLTLILVLLLQATLAFSSALHNALPFDKIVLKTFRDDGKSVEAVIKGVRYLNPKTGLPNTKGIKILLNHGLMSTLHEFDHIVDVMLLGKKVTGTITELMERGFDIYAFSSRGAGEGIHEDEESGRSYVINYQEGDYKFDRQFKDFAAELKYIDDLAKKEGVSKAADRKISVIAHSMGGMVSTAAAATMPEIRKYIKILINIQSPNDFKGAYDDMSMGLVGPRMGNFLINLLKTFNIEYPLLRPARNENSFLIRMKDFLFSENINKLANNTSVTKKLLEVAQFGVKSGSATHRDLLTDMIGYGVHNNYPYVGLDPGVPVANLYGGADEIAPKNSIIEQSKAIHFQGGKVWTLEVKTAGHLDVVFPKQIATYMPYIYMALHDPYLLGEAGSHISVKPIKHHKALLDCASIMDIKSTPAHAM